MATAQEAKVEHVRITVEKEPFPLKRKGHLISQLKEIIACCRARNLNIVSCLVGANIRTRTKRVDGILVRRCQSLGPDRVTIVHLKEMTKPVKVQ